MIGYRVQVNQGSMTVALVTGSTGGIGRATALELADEGVDVVVNGRSPEKGRHLVETLEGKGVNAHFERADINDYQAVETMVDGAIEEMGRLDVLVTSGAAVSGPMPDFFRELSPDDILKFCKGQFLNRLYCIKAVLPHMIQQDGGRIINVSTDAGRVPTPGEVGPGAAGAALLMATRTLASEFSRWKITVNTVCISVVADTPANEWAKDSPAGSIFERAMERQSFRVTDEHIGDMISYLAIGDGAGAMTGQILSVNGGVSFPG
jgi:3-oxoacyl-[acyl-carrier protein] reductase